MKRSEINQLVMDASACFERSGWALPPNPRWDVTDFGLGDWQAFGLVLINLADHAEYCEKLMYAKKGMKTPAHCHGKKKEDIIARNGTLRIQVWQGRPDQHSNQAVPLWWNGEPTEVPSGTALELLPGYRVTLVPGVYHEFEPVSDECVIGEVSTANDDLNDNYFVNPNVGRYPDVTEDEVPIVRLLSDR